MINNIFSNHQIYLLFYKKNENYLYIFKLNYAYHLRIFKLKILLSPFYLQNILIIYIFYILLLE